MLLYGSTQLGDDVQRRTSRVKHKKVHLKMKEKPRNSTDFHKEETKLKTGVKQASNLKSEDREIMQQVKLRNKMHLTMSQDGFRPRNFRTLFG